MSRGSNWGSTTYITTGNTPIITAAPCSLHCWYQPATFSSDAISICAVATSGNSDIFDLQIVASSKFAIAETGQSGQSPVWQSANDTVVQVVGTWSALTGVFASASSRILYRDGAQAATNSGSRTPASIVKSQIGISNGTNAARGLIALVAMWDTALSAADALSLWKGFSPRRIQPSHLKSCVMLLSGTTPATEQDLVNSSASITWTVNGALNASSAMPAIYY